jgi:hypothetical protein
MVWTHSRMPENSCQKKVSQWIPPRRRERGRPRTGREKGYYLFENSHVNM